MFVNFSNHPSDKWDEKQIKAANYYGDIVDIQFPSVPSRAGEDEIGRLAEKYADMVEKSAGKDGAAMVQGEFTLTYAVVNLLKEKGVKVVSACSERDVVEEEDEFGNIVRRAKFDFMRFREYK